MAALQKKQIVFICNISWKVHKLDQMTEPETKERLISNVHGNYIFTKWCFDLNF